MRVVFLGASESAVFAASTLIENQHEVVIIDSDEATIEQLSERLDCSFLHGDGGRPEILREAGAADADVVFCVTNSDQANILAGLVACHLGAKRVVVSIEDPELEEICDSLSLDNVIVPARAIGRQMHDLARGVDSVELSTVLKDDARLFRFVVDKAAVGLVSNLDLPEQSKALWLYRDGGFEFADAEVELRADDEVIVLTHSDHLADLEKRWRPKESGDD